MVLFSGGVCHLPEVVVQEKVLQYIREQFTKQGHVYNTTWNVQRVHNPTPLEFSIITTSSQPTVITGVVSTWGLQAKWTDAYINRTCGGIELGIESSDDNHFFIDQESKTEWMTVGSFLSSYSDPKREQDIYIAETPLSTFPSLFEDAPGPPSFADHLQLQIVHFWMGNGGQTGPLHHDQYENLLCQITGTRTVTLYDPFQVDRLYPIPGDVMSKVTNPRSKAERAMYPNLQSAIQQTVKLHAGEVLYIPAYWWHHVTHSRERHLGINYWFHAHRLTDVMYNALLPGRDSYRFGK